MPRIDAHQHFWKFDPVRDSWITSDMSVIRRDFIPPELEPLLIKNGIEGSVLVQASQDEEENKFLLKLAEEHDFIKAVVGWVDLQVDTLQERLAYYSSFKKVKGFRHVLQGEVKRDLMLSPAFMKGIAKLAAFGFTYDILIYPDQLTYLPAFVSAFPNQLFVIDHIAKPPIKDHSIDEWEKGIRAVAQYENVYCKLSGMLTEADWHHWREEDCKPCLDVVVDAFGANRLMYGSDWPVCLLAGTYEEQMNVVKNYFSSFSVDEQAMIFGETACRFYKLS